MSRPSYAPRLLGMPLGALPTTLNATNSQNSADSAPVGPRGAGRVLGRGGRRWGGTRFPRDRGVLLVARWPGQVLWEICTIARIFRTKRACGAFRSGVLSLLFSPLLSLSLSLPPPFLPFPLPSSPPPTTSSSSSSSSPGWQQQWHDASGQNLATAPRKCT